MSVLTYRHYFSEFILCAYTRVKSLPVMSFFPIYYLCSTALTCLFITSLPSVSCLLPLAITD